MPVFSKGLLCTRSGGSDGGGGGRGRRPGCPGRSDAEDDDEDHSPEVANSSATVTASPPRVGSWSNTEFEAVQADLLDEEPDSFKFLLTLADTQLPPERPETPAMIEFEHAEMLPEPGLELGFELEQPQRQSPDPEPKPRKPVNKPVKRAAKSSCGKANSDEGETTTTEEEPPAPLAGVPLPEPQLPLESLPPREEDAEEFPVLLTGQLAPPDDFRFYLTVHQAEAAS